MRALNTHSKIRSPWQLLDRVKDLARWPSTQAVPYNILRNFGGHGVLYSAYCVLRNRIRPKKTILFYPKQPSHYQAAFKLCTLLGYRMHSSPDLPYDVVFAHEGLTIYPPDHFNLLGNIPIINRNAEDISKKKVEQVFKEVFGYSLGVDPETYEGLAFRKSDDNYTHDGEIVRCPYHIDDNAGLTHQRFIDTRNEDDLFLEARVLVYRSEIPLVYLKYYPDGPDRLHKAQYAEVLTAKDLYSAEECGNLIKLAQNMGVDYCEMDVMRDNNDGRIYVVDVNRTPAGPVNGMTMAQSREALRNLKPVFERLLREFL